MGGVRKTTPAFHKYGPVRVSGKAGAAAEPRVQGRAYVVSPARFPNQAEGSSCPEAFSPVLQNHRCFVGTG